MERCSKPRLRCYVSHTATSGNAFLSNTVSFWWKPKIESVWGGVPGRNGCWSGSRNKSTFQVMLRSSDQCHEICSNSSSIGKRVQAWLARRDPVRLSNSSSIVNEHEKSGFLQIKFRPLPINNLLVKVNHHCCSIIQHPASWSQNQKPRCSQRC